MSRQGPADAVPRRMTTVSSIPRSPAARGARPRPPAGIPEGSPRPHPTDGLAFALFVLVNATLFIRPTEIIPAVQGWHVYEVLILLCAATSLPALLAQLNGRMLTARPVTLCVLGLLTAVVAPHLLRLHPGMALEAGKQFSKVVVYYLLLLANVDSAERLRRFLLWLVTFTAVATVLALLQYHRVVDIPALATLEQREVDEETGEVSVIPRLRSTGIFNDPNDLSLILVTAMTVAMYGLCRRGPSARLVWLALLGLLGYGLMLTQSRGGFLSLLVAAGVFAWAQFGRAKAVLVAALALPVLLVLFAGRQTQFDLGNRNDTAQERVQLWSEGLELFKESPLLGIGYGEYSDRVLLVAHNSFLHSFTELGFLGGALFAGAFGCALAGVWRSKPPAAVSPAASLARQLRPCILAIVAAYLVGILTLSRCYVVPTYLVLGLGAGYSAVAASQPPLRVGRRLFVALFGCGLLALFAIYLVVRTAPSWR